MLNVSPLMLRIDNNESSGLVDDEATFKGDISFWGDNAESDGVSDVRKRMEYRWSMGKPHAAKIGQVGKVAQAMGMAKVRFTSFWSR